ncbi:hypothetical protein CYMTET_5397 [Cymbomonas tetramitiformis]|uniref:Alpha-1,3-mannosyl-glycoprotein 2-beta-N-acetylglucosaminyltransferase n=1 Tax=Cymbomonas tetramitiformis TaxID=36881 RepID=A0AAE0GZ86_9CHLO|nr:hypothetical protein CYMTET_5397 [Cymbomonas tetramitiformis]
MGISSRSDPVLMRVFLAVFAGVYLTVQIHFFSGLHTHVEEFQLQSESLQNSSSHVRALVDETHELKERLQALEADLEIEKRSHRKDVERLEEKRIFVQAQSPPSTPDSAGTLLRGDLKPGSGSTIPSSMQPGDIVAAVVVMTCNRRDYLQRTLQSIFSRRNSDELVHKFPLFVSQDGTNPGVKGTAMNNQAHLTYMQHLETEVPKMDSPKENVAYYRIANHYKWALDELFVEREYERVIILEDDMELAVDFFQYFEATAPLLTSDPSLLCVSSWNDNGQEQFVNSATALFRSDFFPGLGWMLTRDTWMGLREIWPKGYWDDWMRLRHVRRGRQCIRPEVCRTFNFGEQGSSHGYFFKQYLAKIKVNQEEVQWNEMDLRYLEAEAYAKQFQATVQQAQPAPNLNAVHSMQGDVKLFYRNEKDFEQIAKRFGVFGEWKDGTPRGAYRGVVVFKANAGATRIFLVPDPVHLKLADWGHFE